MAAKGKARSRLAALNIRLDRNSRTPLWRQVEKAILRKVASEELLAGDRLPGMRAMAAELADAGVVVSHPRSGVAIARADEAAKPGASRRTEPAALLRPLNGRATHAASVFGGWTPKIAEGRLFMPYVPAMNAVLDQEWLRISSVVARAPWHNSFYGHPAGLPLLRKAIAENFRLKFGTEVDPDNVVVTSGTVQALALCACLLFEQGDSIWVEAPSSRTFAEVLPFWGIKANPMPVDDDGANIAFAAAAFPQARGAFVTSASQMPIGVPLSQSRREALVAWALGRVGLLPRGPLAALVLLVAFLALQGISDGVVGFGPLSLDLPGELYATPWLSWLGLPDATFSSGDYYPLLPYLALYFCGAAMGAWWSGRGYPEWARRANVAPLNFVGRHALAVYVIHQPVLLALCALVG